VEVSIGQEVGHSTEVTASFLLSLGRELPNFVDTNVDLSAVQRIQYVVTDSTGNGPLKGANYYSNFYSARLDPNYKFITNIFSETNSRYEAGMVKVSHRMGRIFDLHASYTYSHSADFNQNESPLPTTMTSSIRLTSGGNMGIPTSMFATGSLVQR